MAGRYEWIPSGVELLTETSEAQWLTERLLPWAASEGVRVGELVPTGFEAYGRILHPARRQTSGSEEPVAWAEVARARGKRIHPQVQFRALVDERSHSVTENTGFEFPEVGTIPKELSTPLIDILVRHTSTPDRCLFCLWDGFGFLNGGSAYLTRARWGLRGLLQRHAMRREARRRSQEAQALLAPIPRVRIHPSPDGRGALREYLLLWGALRSLASFTSGSTHSQSPNIWWPEDRAWVVATEIDDCTTYVGASRACIDDLLASSALEAVPSDPGFRFDVFGDTVNAPHGP